MCISVQIHQERHICTGTERDVQMCISLEFIKKDTFVQAKKELYKPMSEFIKKETFVQTQEEVYKCVSLSAFIKKDTFVETKKDLYKCVSLSNSSRKTHLYIRRKCCPNVSLCRIHQERHICTDTERPVQMCISVEFMKKDTFVQPQKELYKCISLSKFIKKDTFVQTQKQLYNCVSLSNSSRKTHLHRR